MRLVLQGLRVVLFLRDPKYFNVYHIVELYINKYQQLILINIYNLIQNMGIYLSQEGVARVAQIGSCFMWVASFIYPNEHNMNFAQILIAHGFASLIINFFFIISNNESINIKDKSVNKILFIRNLMHTGFRVIILIVSFYLPSPIIHTLTSSVSISVAGIQSLCYGVHLSHKIKIVMVCSIFGVFLQANSKYLQHLWDPNYQFQSQFKNYIPTSDSTAFLIAISYYICIIFWSYSLVIVRYINLSTYQINFQNNVMLCFVGALLYPFMSNSSLYHFFMAIIFSGIFVAVAQILFVYSLKLSTSGGTIMVLNTVNALFAYLLSVFRYNEPINFFSFLGIAIVVTCIVLVIRQKQK